MSSELGKTLTAGLTAMLLLNDDALFDAHVAARQQKTINIDEAGFSHHPPPPLPDLRKSCSRQTSVPILGACQEIVSILRSLMAFSTMWLRTSEHEGPTWSGLECMRTCTARLLLTNPCRV